MQFFVKETLNKLPNKSITVVAATKYFDSKEMIELYNEGITHFGENRVELLLSKKELLKDLPVKWHIIGTLQTKKVKKVINEIDFLHSLDTIKLAQEINKRRNDVLPCFIQVNISNEENKHGLEVDEVIPFLNELANLEKIKVIGLMGMAMHTDNEAIIHSQFQILNDLLTKIKKETTYNMNELSIGMSNDYLIAVEHNTTFLRLGSVLFKREV
jgi:pyridoxal phosphate enzyme (YggS family)